MNLKAALLATATGFASLLAISGPAHADPGKAYGQVYASHQDQNRYYNDRGNHDRDRDRNQRYHNDRYRDHHENNNRRYYPHDRRNNSGVSLSIGVGTSAHRGYSNQNYGNYQRGYNQQYSGGYGDLVIFEHSDFGGQAVPINGDVANLNQLRFNDKISSIVVNSGVWEICTDGYFRGRCYTIDGTVQRLSHGGLNDTISSIRRVGSYRGYR